jgi:diguanylate cyclase (GGDEF)-like protein/PAS domain S-box-containing protein
MPDPRLLALTLLVCALTSFTALMIVQRGMALHNSARQWRLILGGCITGVAIWATHFSGMLAYFPGVDLQFYLPAALVSLVLTCLISMAGWATPTGAVRGRGAFGGAIIGVALLVAHGLDMKALRVPGLIMYRWDVVAGAVGLGLPMCILAGWLFDRRPDKPIPVAAASCFGIGILAFHFTAMSAIGIIPGPPQQFSPLDLDFGDLATLVIAVSAFVVVIGMGVAYHDLLLARASARDRERLRQIEEHHRYSVELNPQIPWIADPSGEVIEISPRWAAMVGRPVDAGLGDGWIHSLHPDDREPTLKVWLHVMAHSDDAAADVRYRLRLRDGGYRWFRARARSRRSANGDVIRWYGTLEDIQDQVDAEAALRESEERYRLASRATNDVIWDLSLEHDNIQWWGAVDSVLGYPEAKDGTSLAWWKERLHPDDRDDVAFHHFQIMDGSLDQWSHEFRFRAASGQYLHLLSRGQAIRNAQGHAVRLIGSLIDITARKRTEEEMRWAATHDPLTQCPNRALFAMRLEQALADAREQGSSVCLIVFDIDRFKTLNDTLGHVAGDALLCEVARRLTRRVSDAATVARLGGDEFAIILPSLAGDAALQETVERLLGDTGMPFVHDRREIEVSLSVGAAVSPNDGGDAEALLKSADLALYSAKAEGQGLIRAFKPEMRRAVERENMMLFEAREALNDDRIVPFYQPKISLQTGEIVGFEALLRWHHHRRGLQPPGALSAAFEDRQLAVQLTNVMLDRICADMARWRDQGIAFERIALNGTTEDFRRGDFVDRILGRLAHFGIPPQMLELEVTETVFLSRQAEEVERTLQALCAAGVSIALDDFGTGYASLTHLKQFPVDTIKIDRSFVSRLSSDAEEDAAIVGALIDLAKNLGIATVAEGVETSEQMALLRARGCDVGQGFLFGRAISAERVPRLMASWEPNNLGHGPDAIADREAGGLVI